MKGLIIILLFPIAGLGQSDTGIKKTLVSLDYGTQTIQKTAKDTTKYKLNHKPDKRTLEIINSGYSALTGISIRPLPNPVTDTPYIKKGMTLLYSGTSGTRIGVGENPDTSIFISGTTRSISPTMDTAIVMIVYCDTSSIANNFLIAVWDDGGDKKTITDNNKVPFTFWKFGYEVNEKSIRDYYSVIQSGIFVDRPLYRYKHVAYLDEKKKPLSKSIVVIISIKL